MAACPCQHTVHALSDGSIIAADYRAHHADPPVVALDVVSRQCAAYSSGEGRQAIVEICMILVQTAADPQPNNTLS